jgi:hypothetical protein
LRGTSLPRVALALFAVVVIAWSAVLWRNENIGYDAADRIFGNPTMSDAEWANALDQLHDAELLDPSTKWRMSRATALLLRDPPAAARLAGSVIEREPDNLEAWLVVMRATQDSDPARAAEALVQIQRLNPPPGSRSGLDPPLE